MSMFPGLIPYKNIVVPEGYSKQSETEDAEEKLEIEQAGMTEAEIRKIDGIILIRRPRGTQAASVIMGPEEIQIAKIPNIKGEIVYGLAEDRELLSELFVFLSRINKASINSLQTLDAPLIKVVLLSKEALPYFINAKVTYVKNWFHRFDNGHLTTHPYLVGYNTCKLLKEMVVENASLVDLSFLNGFDSIDPIMAEKYHSLIYYLLCNLKNNREVETLQVLYNNDSFKTGAMGLNLLELPDELSKFLANMTLFQQSAPELGTEELKALSLQLFGNELVTSVSAFEEVETVKLKYLLEETTPYRVMMQGITLLKQNQSNPNFTHKLGNALEMEIKDFIAYKQGN